MAGIGSSDPEVAPPARLTSFHSYGLTTSDRSSPSSDRQETHEYVWRFLRQDQWNEPAGLNLQGWDKWAFENGLEHHEASTWAFIAQG